MKETYIIKIWETEELRNAGLSDIISSGITDLKTAIKDAKQLMQEQEYASIEVQNSKEKRYDRAWSGISRKIWAGLSEI